MDKPAHGFEAAGGPCPDTAGLDTLTAIALSANPCWLSFRVNHLSATFNSPIYGWIGARTGLRRPEFVVLYSLRLQDGLAARDIVQSLKFPKNTISRAIQALLKGKLIRRAEDETDRRSFVPFSLSIAATSSIAATPEALSIAPL